MGEMNNLDLRDNIGLRFGNLYPIQIEHFNGSEHIQVPLLAKAIQYRSGKERLRG